ncbi:MAG: hypothetical protein WCT16_05080 [Candidatus Buchananbacteria bacterium]
MNTLLNLCLWHSLYIGGLVTAFVLFAFLVLPIMILVNGIKQRHNGWWNFKVVWLPPRWWMGYYYVVDYITNTVCDRIKNYGRIEKIPILTYQENSQKSFKITLNTVEKIVKESGGIIGGLFFTFLACLIIAMINGGAVWVILGITSFLLFLLLSLWWLTLPLIVACLAFSFLYRKYREYQSALKKQRENNEELRAMIEELKKEKI